MPLMIDSDSPPLRLDETNTVRVGGTRVTLDTVVHAFLDGASPEAIAASYSAVSLADVYSTIAYYLRHREQIDAYLQQRSRQAENVRTKIESSPEYQMWRERLLERARAKGLRS